VTGASGETSPALLGTLIALLISSTVFSFGYLKAKLGQANEDYKTTKGKVTPLRKAYWVLWWDAAKVGFWVFLVGFILVAWVIHDAKADR
jgi:ABC-type Fe3+ transport system permease subunit